MSVKALDLLKKNKKKHGIGFFHVFLTVLIIAAILLNVPCFIEQYEKNDQANKLLKELNSEINRGKRLKIEYESRTDYKSIEEYVTESLMMKKTESYQIEYIVNESDNMSEVVKADDYNESIFHRIAKTFSVITEYFK